MRVLSPVTRLSILSLALIAINLGCLHRPRLERAEYCYGGMVEEQIHAGDLEILNKEPVKILDVFNGKWVLCPPLGLTDQGRQKVLEQIQRLEKEAPAPSVTPSLLEL